MQKVYLHITEVDRRRIKAILATSGLPASNENLFVELNLRLSQAIISKQQQIAPYVITMNSQVLLQDLENGTESPVWLVYPGSSSSELSRISLFTGLGLEMLGRKVGDVIQYNDGHSTRRVKISKLLYQPENAGHLGL